MISFRETQIDPAPRPVVAEARVYGNLVAEGAADVVVGGVAFHFWRDGDQHWTGGVATTMARGYPIDEAWIAAARATAVEALRRDLGKVGATTEIATDTVRCPECRHLLCSPRLLEIKAAVMRIECAPPQHLVHLSDGCALVFPAPWMAASDG